MKLTVIGCSGSYAGPDSPASAYLVQARDGERTYSLLFDLGNGALGALQRHLDPWALDGLFLTHLHPDHCLDVTGLYVHRQYSPARPATRGRLPVRGPAGTRTRVTAAYEGMPTDGMDGQFDFESVTDGSTWRLGPFAVTARAVNHPVEAYGYRIEADGQVLVYTGDTDSCAALTELAAGADLLLADSAFVDGRDHAAGVHLSGRRAAQLAVDAGVARLMLTHIPAWNDPQICRAQAEEVWPGEVELARPGESYPLPPAGAGVD